MKRYAKVVAILGLSLFLLNCPTTPKKVNTVAAPAFSPAEGVYTSPQTVSLSTSTEGAEIRYTLDGSAPSATSGTLYTAAFPVSATTTVRAIAYKNGWEDSPVASATFTITGTVAAVQFDPPAGSYDSAISVSLSSATAGAEIWYTMDGSQPAAGKGTKYTGPVALEDSATVAAVAVKQNWAPSAVASASYAVQVVPAVSDEEIMEARNAIARAKEVDADYYDPDNYTAAQGLLDDALDGPRRRPRRRPRDAGSLDGEGEPGVRQLCRAGRGGPRAEDGGGSTAPARPRGGQVPPLGLRQRGRRHRRGAGPVRRGLLCRCPRARPRRPARHDRPRQQAGEEAGLGPPAQAGDRAVHEGGRGLGRVRGRPRPEGEGDRPVPRGRRGLPVLRPGHGGGEVRRCPRGRGGHAAPRPARRGTAGRPRRRRRPRRCSRT